MTVLAQLAGAFPGHMAGLAVTALAVLAALTAGHHCEAQDGYGVFFARCRRRPARRMRRACARGHSREGWLCRRHAGMTGLVCRECHQADGSEAPVTITPAVR